jgi:hypothetical protein
MTLKEQIQPEEQLSRYGNVYVEEFEHEVLTHPVFLLQSAMKEGALC